MVLYARARAQRKYARVKRRMLRKKYKTKRYGSSRLARRVRSIVNGMEETKKKTSTFQYSYNSGIGSGSEMTCILPSISQSVADSGRLGQKIQPMYLVVKGIMSYNTGGANNLPIHPQMFCLIDKTQRNSNLGFSSAAFLDNSGTNVTYDGTWATSKLAVNTEDFRVVKRKTFRLALNFGPGSTSTSLTEPNTLAWREFSFTINLRKYVKYFDYDSSGNQPNNFNLAIGFGYHRFDNTVDVVATPLNVMFQNTLYYKDS